MSNRKLLLAGITKATTVSGRILFICGDWLKLRDQLTVTLDITSTDGIGDARFQGGIDHVIPIVAFDATNFSRENDRVSSIYLSTNHDEVRGIALEQTAPIEGEIHWDKYQAGNNDTITFTFSGFTKNPWYVNPSLQLTFRITANT